MLEKISIVNNIINKYSNTSTDWVDKARIEVDNDSDMITIFEWLVV